MDEPASYFLSILLDETALPVSFGSAIWKLAAVLLLVCANGYFVCSEFALVTVRRTRLEARAEAGSKAARAALRLLSEPTVFISATQLGVTLASLALGWVGEPTLAALLTPLADRITTAGTANYVAHGVAIAIAFLVITFLHIVLGELMPKMAALERAEALALVAAPPLELFAKVFRPAIWVFNKTGTGLGHLLGLKSSLEHTAVYTEAELQQLVDISVESGHLRHEERRLINRVFQFSDTLVREAMVPRMQIASISDDCSLEQIVKAFEQYGYSRLPVFRGSMDNAVGFVHSKDVMPYLLKPEKFRLELVLQAPLYVVDTARLEDVLTQMRKAKTHFGFVVDEHGGIEGIITLEDLLEEIVGDISDEHDEEVNEQITEERDGSFMLDGGLAVRDLNRRLNLSLPESEAYTTIAGFLMNEAGRVLQPGEVVRYDGLLFHIERLDRRRIVRVRLERHESVELAEDETETNSAAAD
ncbi:MAG TPA: hemolysin family protein [Pyrinomonadaceae bacterium]|nr:hemolysin family protein [Pyrinomonadaceae bacterium]